MHLSHAHDTRFDVVRCPACGLLRLREFPGSQELLSYYQENYYREEDASRFPGPLESLSRAFRRRRADRLRRWIGAPPARVLDVGCGRAIFLATMKQWGFDVDGTQLSRTAASYARSHFGVDIFEGELTEAPYPRASFDLVTMWHVLEHTTDPGRYLDRVHELLKPGGRFLVEVPNAACSTARWGRGGWLHWDIPRHLYHFTPQSLERMLAERGFRIAKRSFFSLEYGPFGAVQTLLNCLSGERNYLFESLAAPQRRLSARLALHGVLAAALMPAAIVYCALTAAQGKGDVLTFWCVKSR
jgi:2-polyprenyl-3-methyl-5-hydroxy-6-metoxy-1,4-benzoquinol methylase